MLASEALFKLLVALFGAAMVAPPAEDIGETRDPMMLLAYAPEEVPIFASFDLEAMRRAGYGEQLADAAKVEGAEPINRLLPTLWSAVLQYEEDAADDLELAPDFIRQAAPNLSRVTLLATLHADDRFDVAAHFEGDWPAAAVLAALLEQDFEPAVIGGLQAAVFKDEDEEKILCVVDTGRGLLVAGMDGIKYAELVLSSMDGRDGDLADKALEVDLSDALEGRPEILAFVQVGELLQLVSDAMDDDERAMIKGMLAPLEPDKLRGLLYRVDDRVTEYWLAAPGARWLETLEPGDGQLAGALDGEGVVLGIHANLASPGDALALFHEAAGSAACLISENITIAPLDDLDKTLAAETGVPLTELVGALREAAFVLAPPERTNNRMVLGSSITAAIAFEDQDALKNTFNAMLEHDDDNGGLFRRLNANFTLDDLDDEPISKMIVTPALPVTLAFHDNAVATGMNPEASRALLAREPEDEVTHSLALRLDLGFLFDADIAFGDQKPELLALGKIINAFGDGHSEIHVRVNENVAAVSVTAPRIVAPAGAAIVVLGCMGITPDVEITIIEQIGEEEEKGEKDGEEDF